MINLLWVKQEKKDKNRTRVINGDQCEYLRGIRKDNKQFFFMNLNARESEIIRNHYQKMFEEFFFGIKF